MQIVRKIMTDDGELFDTQKEAKKYLNKKYGEQLTSIAHKILKCEKYIQLCEFLDENLDNFKEVIELKNELKEEFKACPDCGQYLNED